MSRVILYLYNLIFKCYSTLIYNFDQEIDKLDYLAKVAFEFKVINDQMTLLDFKLYVFKILSIIDTSKKLDFLIVETIFMIL